jgi:hypothetical protein
MKKLEVEEVLANHQARMKKMLGSVSNGQVHQTMEEFYEEDRDFEAQLEFQKWMRKMKAMNWQINGKPIIIGSLTAAPKDNQPNIAA